MADAGYAGTPQLKKLGIKAGTRLCVRGADPEWRFDEPPEAEHVAGGPCDVLVVFVRSASELSAVADWGQQVFPAGACWVAWPRKAAGHVSDVDENAIRDPALDLGMVDVKVAAIDEDWSGLKLVWRRENR